MKNEVINESFEGDAAAIRATLQAVYLQQAEDFKVRYNSSRWTSIQVQKDRVWEIYL